MQRQRQLDDTEVGAQVPPGRSDLVDQELANLGGQIAQLLLGKVLQISGPADLFQHPASLRSDGRMPNSTTYCLRYACRGTRRRIPGRDRRLRRARRRPAARRAPAARNRVVTDSSGKPFAVLPASQVVRFIVPRYVQDDPSLAGVLNESMADRAADKLGGKTVRDVLPEHLVRHAVARTPTTPSSKWPP